tara:strand:+ start:263 stop:478 length:216 start_codon:yes stop_codon:yes gene_type:complete
MRIKHMEACDMGPHQQEIADHVLRVVEHLTFTSEGQFFDMEGVLITDACRDLGWQSVPQVGGLLPEWSTHE